MNTILSIFHHAAGRLRRWLGGAVIALGFPVLFLAGYWPRHAAQRQLAGEARAAEQSPPGVKVMNAVAASVGRSLTLPGSLLAYREAGIDARATGYVARMRADIGDRVHAGELLAELDTPELNQQLEQAHAALNQKEAALEQADANHEFGLVTAAREDALRADGLSSQQINDQAHAQVKVAAANVRAARADVAAAIASVRELKQLASYARVLAPFDGRITQRKVDVGTLVSAAPASSAGQLLFRIEAVDPIRVFVQVPQTFALGVKQGLAASVSVRQLPGRVFDGHVTRTAGTLDPSSRTLNVEVDVPNASGELLSGMFAQVTIAVAVPHRAVRVPSSAVITDARGVHIAIVDSGHAHLASVVRGLDDGREIELVEGLQGGEQVIVNPAADLTEGSPVTAVR
jgi:RND family efflux transporter MFP subunit